MKNIYLIVHIHRGTPALLQLFLFCVTGFRCIICSICFSKQKCFLNINSHQDNRTPERVFNMSISLINKVKIQNSFMLDVFFVS